MLLDIDVDLLETILNNNDFEYYEIIVPNERHYLNSFALSQNVDIFIDGVLPESYNDLKEILKQTDFELCSFKPETCIFCLKYKF